MLIGRIRVMMVEKEEVDKLKNNKNQINYVTNTLSRMESNLSVVTKNTDNIARKISDDFGTDWIRLVGKTVPYVIMLLLITDNIMWFKGTGSIKTVFRCLYMIAPMVALLWTMKSKFFKSNDKTIFYIFVISSLAEITVRIMWDIFSINHFVLLSVSLLPLIVAIVFRVLIYEGR